MWKMLGNILSKSTKISKDLKQVNSVHKFSILLRSLLQPVIYFIFFFESVLSGDHTQLLAPLICFLISGATNISLILSNQSHLVFILVQTILMSGSLVLITQGEESTNLIELDDQQKHSKMAITQFYFTLMLTSKLDFKSNLEKGILFLFLLAITSCYQIIFYRDFKDLCAMFLFIIFGSYTVWEYQRILESLGGYHSGLSQRIKEQQLNEELLQMKLYQDILKDVVNDGVFIAQLEESSNFLPKLQFYEKNSRLNSFFDLRLGVENVLDKMIIDKSDFVLYFQKKIFKLMQDNDNIFEETLYKIATKTLQNSLSKNSNSNKSESKQQLASKKGKIEIEKMKMLNTLTGNEEFQWNLRQLVVVTKIMKENILRDKGFNKQKASQQQFINHFSLMEVSFVCFFLIKRRDKKIKNMNATLSLKNSLSTLIKEVEVKYLLSQYSVQIIRCTFKKKDSLIFAVSKPLISSSNNIFKNNSQTSDNSSQEEVLKLFNFFKNRTEKISKAITSSICRADCLRQVPERYQKGPSKTVICSNENQLNNMSKVNNDVNSLICNLEYLRMIMKDTEEYRDFLEDQTYFSQNDSRMKNELRISRRNISKFKFSQLIEEIKKIFNLEVSFKSTYINIVQEVYWKPKESILPTQAKALSQSQNEQKKLSNSSDENLVEEEDESQILYNDYEKLKRVLILLIENSLSFQNAGLIEIELVEEKQNILRVKIIDNQYMNLSDEEIKNINKNGCSDKGFGIAIANALLTTIKPKQIHGGALEIRKDFTNEKSNIVFWISKSIYEDSSHINFTTMNTMSRNLHQQDEKKNKIEQSNAANGSLQPKDIENIIKQQMNIFNENNNPLGNLSQKNIQPQLQQRLLSQQQIYSHLILPGKNQQTFSQFQYKLRQTLVNLTSPASFLDIYNNNKKNEAKDQQNNNNFHGASLWNAQISVIQQHLQQQQQQPLFLIVSPDFRTSASIYNLLTKMCKRETSVKFASNRINMIDLLSKNIFEYIFIDKLEGVQLKEIFYDINKNYKNRKQLQKIIFFDFYASMQKDLEAQIPLLASQEVQREDIKQEFCLQPPTLQFPIIKSHNKNFSTDSQRYHHNSARNTEQLEEEDTHQGKSLSQHSMSSNSSGSNRSIPIEGVMGMNKKKISKKNKSNGKIRRSKQDEKDDEIKTSSKIADSTTSHTITQLHLHSNRNKHFSLPPIKTFSHAQGIHQDINGENTVLLNSSNLSILNHMNNKPPTNALKEEFIPFSSQRQRSASDSFQFLNEEKVILQIPSIKSNVNIENLQFVQTEDNEPLSERQKKGLKSPQVQKSQLQSGRFSPSRNQGVQYSFLKRKSLYYQEGQNRNPQTQNKIEEDFVNSPQNINIVSNQQFKRQSHYDTGVYAQDQIRQSFDPKYNESIEVASCLKFAYFSLEYPFGYAQIYEALCHMNFARGLLNLNQNFFNLNRPELYQSHQY